MPSMDKVMKQLDNPKSKTRAMLIDTELMNVPDMSLLKSCFALKTGAPLDTVALLDRIRQDNMAPLYKYLSEAPFNAWVFDQSQYDALHSANEQHLKHLEERLEDAKVNLGSTELFEIMTEKAIFLGKILDKDGCLSALRQVQEKAATTGTKLDLIFSMIRIGFFFGDIKETVLRNIEKAEDLMESTADAGGADWERRNRLKVYKGLARLCCRDIAQSCSLFIETLSTFHFTELMTNDQLVLYAALSSILQLSRTDLHKKILLCPEIMDGFQNMPQVAQLVESFYECRYGAFFQALAQVDSLYLSTDIWLQPFRGYFVKELCIASYKQFLTAYQSVTLAMMSEKFGVSEEWLENELFTWISNGRLDCIMDQVEGTIQLNHFKKLNGHKNSLYEEMVKSGDLLLNRLQKLGRVVNA